MNAIRVEVTMDGKKTTQIVDGDQWNSHPVITQEQIEVASEKLVAAILGPNTSVSKKIAEWCSFLGIRDVADLEHVAVYTATIKPGFHWDRNGYAWVFHAE